MWFTIWTLAFFIRFSRVSHFGSLIIDVSLLESVFLVSIPVAPFYAFLSVPDVEELENRWALVVLLLKWLYISRQFEVDFYTMI